MIIVVVEKLSYREKEDLMTTANYVVSHGYDVETNRTVILPHEKFWSLGDEIIGLRDAKWDVDLQEYVIHKDVD